MEVNRSKFIIYFISCFLFTRVRKDFRFFFCPRGTGSSFERFEFARYLSPFNGSLGGEVLIGACAKRGLI